MDQTVIDVMIAAIQAQNWPVVAGEGLVILGTIVSVILALVGKPVPIIGTIIQYIKNVLPKKAEDVQKPAPTVTPEVKPETEVKK